MMMPEKTFTDLKKKDDLDYGAALKGSLDDADVIK